MSKPNKERRAQSNTRTSLDEVLEAYVMSEEGPSPRTLATWIRRYPEYEEELTRFTARWGLATHLPDSQDHNDPDEETLIRRGMSVVQDVLRQESRTSAPEVERTTPNVRGADRPARESWPTALPRERVSGHRPQRETGDESADPPSRSSPPIQGLLTEGARWGLTADTLADQTGLSVFLLAKMERRLIAPDTIPHQVSERIAAAVRRDVAVVRHYSRHPPGFAQGAAHRANQAPTLPEKLETFFEAVRADPELSNEQRKALLALEPNAGEADGE